MSVETQSDSFLCLKIQMSEAVSTADRFTHQKTSAGREIFTEGTARGQKPLLLFHSFSPFFPFSLVSAEVIGSS